MGNFFRNQPFMLLIIALILISPTLETRGSGEEQILEVKNEFMQVNFVWHKHAANHWWIKMNEHQDEAVTITNYHFLQSMKEVSVDLSFDFYLFGHNIRKVRLSKHGGIRSFGNHTASDWYISPLSVDPSRVKHSKVQYIDFGNAFAVRWEFESDDWDGKLSFQAVVQRNGIIEFAYKQIPFGSLANFRQISQDITNVFGVAHSYKLLDTTFWLGYTVLIEDHDRLAGGSMIYFKQLPSCSNYRSCGMCNFPPMTNELGQIKCSWCPAIQSCSSKKDFLWDAWQRNDCDQQEISDMNQCPENQDLTHAPGLTIQSEEHFLGAKKTFDPFTGLPVGNMVV
ncbi:plexin domain-containing protein 2-like [Cloeon dipterum]|uniref:plexin domain-containing protein 2-like n=1 Tax=Cloeon dipterum TaxID=197152 RepID=UPI00322024CB